MQSNLVRKVDWPPGTGLDQGTCDTNLEEQHQAKATDYVIANVHIYGDSQDRSHHYAWRSLTVCFNMDSIGSSNHAILTANRKRIACHDGERGNVPSSRKGVE